jgi:glycosyltransferase involved in cell wall biosynthesis
VSLFQKPEGVVTSNAGSVGASGQSPAASDAPTVTVVVCAYTQQRWPELTLAMESVSAQRTPPAELILVIDHEPMLLDRARAAFPGATVVASTGTRGLSGARNTGADLARGEVVAFLDDDAVAAPEWLSRLTRHYDDPAVLAVGGSATPAWEASRPSWLPSEFDWVVGCTYTGQPSHLAPVRNLIGCNMSMRRDALGRAGGFNAALGRVGKVPLGCEETELCIRLGRQRADGVILYDPSAGVRHRVTAERGTWRYFWRRCFAEGRSKAIVARLVGKEAALSSEREYVRRTLPEGIRRELSASRHDATGLLRAGVIAAGVVIATTGHFLGRFRRLSDVSAGGSTSRPSKMYGRDARRHQ